MERHTANAPDNVAPSKIANAPARPAKTNAEKKQKEKVVPRVEEAKPTAGDEEMSRVSQLAQQQISAALP